MGCVVLLVAFLMVHKQQKHALVTHGVASANPSWEEIDRALSQNKLNDAMAQIKQLVAQREQYPYAERLLANLYSQAKKHDEAVRWFEIYLGHSPDDDRSRLSLAKSLAALGQTEDAYAVTQQILSRHANYREALERHVVWGDALGHDVQNFKEQINQLHQPSQPPLVVHKR